MDIAARLIATARTRAGLTQQQLADRAATSQSAIARLERGGASPSVETISRLVAAAGFSLRLELDPVAAPDALIEAYKRDVDRTLIRENLRRSVDDRLRSLEDHKEFAYELRRSMTKEKRKRQ